MWVWSSNGKRFNGFIDIKADFNCDFKNKEQIVVKFVEEGSCKWSYD